MLQSIASVCTIYSIEYYSIVFVVQVCSWLTEILAGTYIPLLIKVHVVATEKTRPASGK